jgi:TetR/AcrR family transcriptional regulator, tetracycline repressor protein
MSRPESPAGSTGPREPLNRARIVAAAVVVLDADGLAGLTMRRVARELGTGAMSLYRHVASREELLDLVLDELVGAVPVSRLTGEWRVDVAALARDVRGALLRRRDLTLLLTARLGQGAGGLAALDRALGIFLRAGFSPRDAVRSNHALGAYVSGSCTWEAVGLGGEVDPAERANRAAAATARLAEVPAEAHPYVAAAAGELFAGTAEDRFEFGLARLLEGFAVELAATAARPPRLDSSSVGGA